MLDIHDVEDSTHEMEEHFNVPRIASIPQEDSTEVIPVAEAPLSEELDC